MVEIADTSSIGAFIRNECEMREALHEFEEQFNLSWQHRSKLKLCDKCIKQVIKCFDALVRSNDAARILIAKINGCTRLKCEERC